VLSSPLHLGHSISPHYHSNRALRRSGQDWQWEEESGRRETERDVRIPVGTPMAASILAQKKGDVEIKPVLLEDDEGCQQKGGIALTPGNGYIP